ncbi:hypothetical protein FE773_00825 [Caminibacter mediatlanticus TB-2]|uniref:DNA primase n=1 Tax=Caminibacter mediatlanticus TB-2 TaxID=391592 RepID=A0ABX5V668_9BACT|nr:hypothetical protein [Caminibacter mediatlanticus]QCT93770.1 hypothetical protein FE773_00825 [Caminibacter mediatlanticus TB-2]
MKLPDPSKYKTFKPKVKPKVYQEKKWDFEKLKQNEYVWENYFSVFYPKFGLIDKLFTNDLLPLKEYERLKLYKEKFESGNIRLLYSMLHDSIVIELYDNNELISLIFRHYYEKITKIAEDKYLRNKESVIKWKTYGSKRFIPYRLTDGNNYCFCAFGMAEILLFELLEVDYFVLQSDSIADNISNNPYFEPIKEKLKNRAVYIIPDNDESSFKASQKLKEAITTSASTLILPLEKITGEKLPKGYDLRDFFNEYSKVYAIELIMECIKKMKGES